MKLINRVAFFNTIAAAATTLVVFGVIYFVVYFTTYRHLDTLIQKERDDVFEQIKWDSSGIYPTLIEEWEEKEHRQVEVNPIFLQVADKQGRSIFKSINLQTAHLLFDTTLVYNKYINHYFKGQKIRQGQFAIYNDKAQILGYLGVAVSQVEAELLLKNLGLTLLISFPILIFIFYWATSFAASRGISPIQQLIDNTRRIDVHHMEKRLSLPAHQDEIYQLVTTFNELLNRIENNLKREKQITANVSHELRTPLAAIRGTLEVLVRKPREPEQYVQKIQQVIEETIKANHLLDQLLNLARIESGQVQAVKEPVLLNSLIMDLKKHWQNELDEKQIHFEMNIPPQLAVIADANLLELIISNLMSNALKYSPQQGTIKFDWNENTGTLAVSDDGTGIPPEHLPHIFDPFYRVDVSRNSKIPGTGLGLSIAKKLADLQHFALSVESKEAIGTSFYLKF